MIEELSFEQSTIDKRSPTTKLVDFILKNKINCDEIFFPKEDSPPLVTTTNTKIDEIFFPKEEVTKTDSATIQPTFSTDDDDVFPIRGKKKLPEVLAFYNSLGWVMLPLGQNTKLAACKYGTWESQTLEELTYLYNHYEDCNWAVILGPSNLLLLDIDNKSGRSGDDVLAELTSKFGPLPKTVQAKTPNNGTHYYFQLPPREGWKKKGDSSMMKQGIEIKTGTMLGLINPSTINGKAYEWVNNPEDYDLAEAPEWLQERVYTQNVDILDYKQAEPILNATIEIMKLNPNLDKKTREVLDGKHDGGRNNSIFAASGQLRALGYQQEDVLNVMLPIAKSWDYPTTETVSTVNSAFTKEPLVPKKEYIEKKEEERTAKMVEEFKQLVKSEERKSNYIKIKDEWFAPKLIDIRNNFFAEYQSRNGVLEKNKMMMVSSMYAAMVAIKALLGKRYSVEKGKPYIGSDAIILLNGTTTGKTVIQEWIQEKIYQRSKLYLTHQITLNSTINYALREGHNVYCKNLPPPPKGGKREKADIILACEASCESLFFTSDEIIEPLGKLKGEWSNGKQTAEGTIMKMLDNPTSGPVDSASNNAGTSAIYDYAFCFFGGTTPSKLKKSFNLFSNENIESGFSSRFLCVHDNEYTYDYDNADLLVKNKIEDIMGSFIDATKDTKKAKQCYFSPESRKCTETISYDEDNYIFERFKKEHEVKWKAAKAKTLRQAMTDAMFWAISENKQPQKINEYIGHEIDCSEYLERCFKARIAVQINTITFMEGLTSERYTQAIIAKIRANPGIKRGELKHEIEKDKFKHELVTEELDELVAEGVLIEYEDLNSGKGRRAKKYIVNKEKEQTNE